MRDARHQWHATIQTMALGAASMSWNLNTWRSRLRLASALVLLSFVICHLTAHSFLLISFERADAALDLLMTP